jgi:hypothetical protein
MSRMRHERHLRDLVVRKSPRLDDRPHPREAEHHHPDQGPVANARDRVRGDYLQELPRLHRAQHRGLALFDDVLGAADRRGFFSRTWPSTKRRTKGTFLGHS